MGSQELHITRISISSDILDDAINGKNGPLFKLLPQLTARWQTVLNVRISRTIKQFCKGFKKSERSSGVDKQLMKRWQEKPRYIQF